MSQFDALRSLLRDVIPSSRFQSARIFEPASIRCLEDFIVRVPLTSKADLAADLAAHPPYGSNLTFPIERYTRFCQTSGTTSDPLVILDTNASWDWMLMNWAGIYAAAGLGAGERIYFAFSFGPFLGFWTAFEAAARCSYLCIPGGGLRSEARMRAILRHQASVLCCTPTYALHLAQVARREGLPMKQSPVRKIIVAGEPGGSVPEVRARISEAWNGAEVFDHYGMTEVGPVAYQPINDPGSLHVISDSYFAEVIDPRTGAPCPDGTAGELVLTPLGRVSWPLLRYRTGDLVKKRPGPTCILEGGIIGRVDDMIVVRGVNIYPAAVDAIIRKRDGVLEYRVTVSRAGELLEMTIEIEEQCTGVAKILEQDFENAFAMRVPVIPVAVGTLPRFEMKAKRWVKKL